MLKSAIFLALFAVIAIAMAMPRPDEAAAGGDDEASNRHRYWGYQPGFGNGGFGGGYGHYGHHGVGHGFGHRPHYGGGYGGYYGGGFHG